MNGERQWGWKGLSLPEGLRAAAVVFIAALAHFLFWLHRQPFFDDDYSRWLIPSREIGWGAILGQIVTPFPDQWGFLDRPVILLFFKFFDTIVGPQPSWFYAAKAAVAAALAALLFLIVHALLRPAPLSARRRALLAALPSLLFVAAEPVFMSMLWLCDMEMLAEFSLLLALALYLLYRSRGMHRRPWCLAAVSLQLLIVAVALIGFRTKSSARLLPAVIFLHLLLTDRASLRHFLPLIGVLVLVNVPWPALGRQPVPEFLAAPGHAGPAPNFYWSGPTLQSARERLLGEPAALWPFAATRHRPYGILPVLFPFALAAAALAGAALYRARRAPAAAAPPTDPVLPLAGIWLALALGTLPIYPRVPLDDGAHQNGATCAHLNGAVQQNEADIKSATVHAHEHP